MADPKQDGRGGAALLRFLPVVMIVAGLIAGYLFGLQDYLSLDYLAASRDWLKAGVSDDFWTWYLAFGLLYVLAVAFSFPAATILTVFAGFLFGTVAGGSLVAVAATTGATIIFLAARSACGDFFRRRFGDKAARVAEGFERNAFSYLLALRIAPIFPFFVMNILPAFFEVRVKTFAFATFLGILPGTFAYAFLGSGIDGALAEAARVGERLVVSDLVTVEITAAFAALALVAIVPTVVRKWMHTRRAD